MVIMKINKCLLALTIVGAFLVCGCSKQTTTSSSPTGATDRSQTPSALPEEGFKATINLIDPPAKLRAGEKATIQVKVKNSSGILWYARGAKVNNSSDAKFILAAGDRWFNAADEKLVTDMDGRHGLNKDLRPGEETEIPLTITAPKEPGDYILEVDLVQEQVAWFHDKGSPTARTKVTVVR
jgi:hypothetical protein